jgi:hypothetical protein
MSLLPQSVPNKELCCALKDVWAVRIFPDMAIDPTIPLPARFSKLFDTVAGQLPGEEGFFFWLVKCQFNAGSSIDNHFEFHGALFGRTDEDIRVAIQAVLPSFNDWKEARDGVAKPMNESDALEVLKSIVVSYCCNY